MNTILTLFFIALFWVGLGALTHFLRIDFIEILKEENLPVNQRPLWQAVLAIILVKSAVTRTGKQLSECLDEREPKLTETFKKWPLIVVVALIRSLGILSLMKTRLHDLWQNNTMHKVRKIRAKNKKIMREIHEKIYQLENELDDSIEELKRWKEIASKQNPSNKILEEMDDKISKTKTEMVHQATQKIKKYRDLSEKYIETVLEEDKETHTLENCTTKALDSVIFTVEKFTTIVKEIKEDEKIGKKMIRKIHQN